MIKILSIVQLEGGDAMFALRFKASAKNPESRVVVMAMASSL